MVNECLACRKKFTPKSGSKGKYCSYKCMYKGQITKLTKKCNYCKKTFKCTLKSGRKYCSRECYYKMKKKRGDRVDFTPEIRKKISLKMSGKNNPNYGNPRNVKGYRRPEMTGSKHPNWKGGYWITKDGYKVIENLTETNGKKVQEHRKVLEEYLGRKLTKHEIVHHINKNTSDNKIENLMICTRAEHINIHRKDLIKPND